MWSILGKGERKYLNAPGHMTKIYINDDPGLTLTFFTTISNLAKLGFVLIVGPDIR